MRIFDSRRGPVTYYHNAVVSSRPKEFFFSSFLSRGDSFAHVLAVIVEMCGTEWLPGRKGTGGVKTEREAG